MAWTSFSGTPTHTLLVDLDGPDAQKRFKRLWRRTKGLFGLTVKERWPSKSHRKGHEHLVITSEEDLSVEARLLLQVGSVPGDAGPWYACAWAWRSLPDCSAPGRRNGDRDGCQ